MGTTPALALSVVSTFAETVDNFHSPSACKHLSLLELVYHASLVVVGAGVSCAIHVPRYGSNTRMCATSQGSTL
eukprot:scaffold329168_cov20-Prasinocladus_malaysianus.AAC.1